MAEKDSGAFDVFERELRLAPRQVLVRLLERMEEFLSAVVPGKSYPFDFIFYCVTGHRPESVDSVMVGSDETAVELAVILERLGRTIRVDAGSIPERVWTVDELSRRWGVSSATVLRWRRQGLASRLFSFGKGRRKVGVRESLARRFEDDRGRLIRRGRSRRKITDVERRGVLEAAIVGLAREKPPGKIVAELAERFVLTQSTVQRILTDAALGNPALGPLMRASVSRRETERILSEVREGACVGEVARRHGRSEESVRRICLRGRARDLLRRKRRFIDSEEFGARGARDRILKAPELAPGPPGKTASADELPVYLKGIAGVPLLTREREAALFRKYNYLKYLASRQLEKLNARRPSAALVDRIEALFAEAARVRERLVCSNLRLVVSIAKRHHGRRTDFAQLVSDGNVALLDAIEAFDYMRGNRFSTYAGWAIVRRFARTVPEENYAVTSVEEEILENTVKVEVDYTALRPSAIASGLAKVLTGLPERERVVIESRFGLGGHPKPCTLKEVGVRFGVTKERIRQIEAQALIRLESLVKTIAPELAGGT